MQRINTGRVLLGGLLAGVVANALDFVWYQFLMVEDMQILTQRLNLDPMVVNGTGMVVTWMVIDFLFGLLLVWTYAAFRPRCGPGPSTAVYAALVPFVAVELTLYGYTAMGVFVLSTFVKGSIFFLITMVAAALAGASIYRED